MDFCYAWLRRLLSDDVPAFQGQSTRADRELTGNKALGRGLDHFTDGLSNVFCNAARALKDDAPFVFTYHHNDVEAYAPVCAALLDAGLLCTAVLPAPAEMGASIHINGTGSSTVDSVIVARRGRSLSVEAGSLENLIAIEQALFQDAKELLAAKIRVTKGDLKCLALGLVMAGVNRTLFASWKKERSVAERRAQVCRLLADKVDKLGIDMTVERVHENISTLPDEDFQMSLFNVSPAVNGSNGRTEKLEQWS